MKVMFLARYLPDEGSTTHMYALARGLRDRGHEVHLISSGPVKGRPASIDLFDKSRQDGLIHHNVSFPNEAAAARSAKVTFLLKYLGATPKVLYTMLKERPDVVHVHYPVTSYLAKIYKMITRKPFIMTYHTSNIPKHPLHKKADKVIAISKEMKKELLDVFEYSEEQIQLIFNGVSKENFYEKVTDEKKRDVKRELGLPVDVPVIGFVGSFVPYKGIDLLIEACRSIQEPFHLVLLGGGDMEWVDSMIADSGLRDRISVHPFQNPKPFYEAFDMLVLPSRIEGFPLVPLEAMMMGVPVIRSNVAGAYDQIIHGETGYVFESENVEELQKYITILLQNPTLRHTMAQTAQAHTLHHFTEETMLTKLLEVYESGTVGTVPPVPVEERVGE
ncbi:glycosyltransferase family 1 protein [Halobacillus fulvus]|nr:glycosyltransferase family 1 protein [Halobacillus fulvus]